jgi:SAM-dependent methyltransferase
MNLNFTAKETQLDAETMWDAKAEHYHISQKRQGMKDSYQIAEMLHKKKQLMEGTVLDVGGGVGLYAIPFATYAKSVTITDLSAKMLAYAKENADDAGLCNLEFVKLDWDQANFKNLGWEKQFDLVFASMCPAIRDGESIDKMIAASKNWCCINRFIKMKDSVAERIEAILNYSEPFDPHNNRNRVQTIFNYLWEKGFEPEIDYFEETTETFHTLEEATKHYGRRFATVAENQHVDLREIISNLAENNRLKVLRNKKLALISWQV